MSEPKQELPYRPCVGILMFNDEGRVFVGKRIDMPEPAWQMPQGGIDAGEATRPGGAARAGRRDRDGQRRAGGGIGGLDQLRPPRRVGRRGVEGPVSGTNPKVVPPRGFSARDTEIDVHGVATPEFGDWRWVGLDELPSLIVPFKRRVYELVVAEFRGIVVKSN